MAKTTFRDVLVKLSNVYLTDIYIYKNQYILGGDLSNLNNILEQLGDVYGQENEETLNIIKEFKEIVK